MNRVEQKERLTELISTAENSVSGVRNVESDFKETVAKYKDLYDGLESEGYSDALEKDVEGFSGSLLRQMIDGSANLEDLDSEIDSFKEDLDGYAEDLSEYRQEQIEEKYADWEDVVDKMSCLVNDDDLTIESSIEMLEEIIALLKQFKK